jgi:hypothetical protein
MKRILLVLLALPLVTGCDVVKQRMGIQDPAKLEAEGNAIGSACRHAGRGLEDCYKLNPKAPKAAVFSGWKEMNEYMLKNNMQAMPPQLSPDTHPQPSQTASSHEGESKAAENASGTEKPVEAHDKSAEKLADKPSAEAKKDGAAH